MILILMFISTLSLSADLFIEWSRLENNRCEALIGIELDSGKRFGHFSEQSEYLSEKSKFLGPVEFISHRGLCGKGKDTPCNTIDAVEEALYSGYAMVEIDVWNTIDNVFYVSHDNNLKAATNCKSKINESYSKDLENCRVMRSPLIPELKILSKKKYSNFPSLTSLNEMAQYFFDENSLKSLVVDIKPRDIGSLKKSLSGFMSSLSPENSGKIMFIVKDKQIVEFISSYNLKNSTNFEIALEGKMGGEPLTNHQEYLGDKNNHDIVSLTYGLGGGIVFGHLGFHKRFQSKNNKGKLFRKYFESQRSSDKETMLWTLNKKKSLNKVWRFKPAYIMSDLPYNQIIETQLNWLESHLNNSTFCHNN